MYINMETTLVSVCSHQRKSWSSGAREKEMRPNVVSTSLRGPSRKFFSIWHQWPGFLHPGITTRTFNNTYATYSHEIWAMRECAHFRQRVTHRGEFESCEEALDRSRLIFLLVPDAVSGVRSGYATCAAVVRRGLHRLHGKAIVEKQVLCCHLAAIDFFSRTVWMGN